MTFPVTTEMICVGGIENLVRKLMRAPNHLNALRAFEAAARHLSYVAAADELNVTPAAVGSLVRGLEAAVGVELFHRSQAGPARLELTEAGRAALPDLQAGFDHLTVAYERLKASRGQITISLTVPPAFADKWLLPRVERFAANHPLYDLLIDTSGRLVDFTAERMDVGIRYGGGSWPGLKSIFLLRDAFFPVCSPALVKGLHPLQGPEDLKHHTLIHDRSMAFESAFPTWRTWLQAAGCSDINCERGLQINDSAAAYQAAMNGSGVALGRTTLVALDLAAGRLIRPFGEALDCELAYYLVHRPRAENHSGISAFKDWICAEVETSAAIVG
ncbi:MULTISPECIES: transcriptional regulator GcvA [Bradyrhizobium]|uniref:transcriptional regulator GcvA n=1 Tax=Bradyrhizobium TaxID=374 RepID=UPI001E575647|nr:MULTISPECIES: transcriptional regulator GcvA [Bradyrhizobium]UFW50585.1 transcriptional regulator GcvA [Bradyrhizobium arachidis]